MTRESIFIKKNVIGIIAYLFSLLFLYTAMGKFLTLDRFSYDLQGIPTIKDYSTQLSIIIPSIELLTGFSLLFPKTRTLGLFASLILMTTFTFYVLCVLLFVASKERPCTCGGLLRALTWNQHLWFNILFTFLALISIILSRIKYSLPTVDLQ